MDGNNVDTKDVSTPRGDHVQITDARQYGDEQVLCMQTGHPQDEYQQHGTHGDTFVIEATPHAPH